MKRLLRLFVCLALIATIAGCASNTSPFDDSGAVYAVRPE